MRVLPEIFKPALSLMNRLPFRRKMALTAGVMVLPVVVFTYLLASGIGREIDTSRKELYGLRYIRLVMPFLRDVQQHREFANAYLEGDASYRIKLRDSRILIEGDMRALEKLHHEREADLKSNVRWGLLKEKWHVLRENVPSMSPEESFIAHTSFINDILVLISHAAGASHMLTDSDSESYYLIDTVVDKIPLATEYAGQMQGLGTGKEREGLPHVRERTYLLVLSGFVKLAVTNIEENMGKAFMAGPGMKAELEIHVRDTGGAVRQMDALYRKIISERGVRIDPGEYDAALKRVIDAGYRFNSAVLTVLERVLKERELRLVKKRTGILLGVGLSFLAAFYLLAAHYLSIVSPLSKLVEAAHRIGKGNLDVQIPIVAKDEMGLVAASFNEMAKSFARQTVQLRSANDEVKREVSKREKTEKRLRKSEAMLKESQRLAHLGSYRINVPGGEVCWSEEIFRIVGRDPVQGEPSLEEYIGHFVHPDDRHFVRYMVSQATREGKVFKLEYRIVLPDGSVRYVHSINSAMKEDDGRVSGIFGTVMDITERKRVEMELARLSRQNELILDSAGEGIFGLDTKGNHTFINHAAAAMLGYGSDELIGMHSHSTWHHTRTDGSPYPEEECRIYATMRDGMARRSDDEVFWKKDGTSFPVEYTATPLYENSIISGAVVTFRDITERRHMEEVLVKSERRYRLIVETTAEWIWESDPEGRITYSNAAVKNILGYRPEELTGINCLLLMHEDDRKEAEKMLLRYVAEKRGWSDLVIRWSHKKGGFRYLESSTVPLLDERGEVAGYIGFDRDISEQRRAEEALRQANDTLFRSVSELEQRKREVELLGEMGSLLQACVSLQEVYAVAGKYVQQLFQDDAGAVYLLASQGNLLESIAMWGVDFQGEQLMTTHECWALRLGRTYVADVFLPEVPCSHWGALRTASLCVPMAAQGETLGLLTLQFHPQWLNRTEEMRGREREHKRRLAETVAESIGLSVANFRLRETLFQQSIHDPLTGLYNRRYMDGLLQKELHRMERRGLPLGIIMLDLDHFKGFNDTFGHEAGDMLLREFGVFLKRNIREEDYACRYGGEEFVVLLPETGLESARQRAEQLRERIKGMRIPYQGRMLDPITLSLGIAVYPKDGKSAVELLRAADSALYRAKAEGRDRVATV